MTFIILAVILIALTGIGTAFAVGEADRDGHRASYRKFVIAGGTSVLVLMMLFFAVHRLGTGQVGLVYDFSGKLAGSKTQPGVVFTAPWQSLTKVNAQLQSEEFVLSNDSKLGAAVTKDQQAISATLQINYHVDPNDVIALYQNVGPSWKTKLVDSRVLQDFKEITSTYPTIQITQSREQLRTETRDRLRKEFAPYSIDVTDFFIKNIGFSKSYSDAIEAKQKQVQAAAQAQAKVAQAQAEADQTIKKAQGDAEAIRLKGKALRDNPQVLSLEYIDKLAPNVKLIVPQGSTLVTGVDGSTAGAVAGK